jgi:hypothetical protein
MDWIEIVNLIVGIFGTVIGIIGGSVGIIYWRENKAIKSAEAQKSTTDARMAEADLAEKILEKYEKGILARMDSGEAVRQREFSDLTHRIDQRFDSMEAENNKQNGLLADIVEFLNGDFQQFEANKGKTPKGKKKP